ncbi:hypothetical protein N2152v2_002597 [Parachlorella kessleri]
MRKKVDPRIRTLVENGVKLRQRSLFVIVGDKGRDQVVNLHYMLSKTVVKARPSVLWCYKRDLYLSSHRKKRMKQIKKMAQRGLLDPDKEDPFALFVASTNIRYCYYSETHKILGSTYGMLVLQDFEALTPNLLARTVETVEGGGIVVLLLSSLTSLTQLYSLTMDVHARLATEAHADVRGRFNERLVLSLASCPSAILMDDELNILPTSTHVKYIQPLPTNADGTPAVETPGSAAAAELKELASSLADTQPAGALVSKCHILDQANARRHDSYGALVSKCRTLDQAKAVVTFLDAASEKTLRSTVALTAARGRGKSAALGLAIAGALALGYSNIFVTAPSPENLRTLFEFVFKGLDEMEYKEHIDYDLVESTNPAFARAIIRVNVFRGHRQTVQYIQPQHHASLAQAELLVIDEAAAIPLPLVKAMLGPYLVFLCSTVNGYEGTGRSLSLKLIQQLRQQGTGRSLSLKLIQQLRQQGAKLSSGKAGAGGEEGAGAGGLRTFREVVLQEPIRYAAGDKVERWLNDVLCLDAAEALPPPPPRLPHPDECQLYFVERDTLFSYHKASELFLQRMMALYVSSHYKNTPNDLLLMSDAPAHRLFVLLGPVDETQAFVQPALRIIGLLSEQLAPRAGLPPLLVNLTDRPAERLHYLGTSYGLTQQLYNFWKKAGFRPVYLRQTPSDVTGSDMLTPAVPAGHAAGGCSLGEHTVIMLRPLATPEISEGLAWLDPFVADFRARVMTLMGGAFRDFAPALALSLLDPKLNWTEEEGRRGVEQGGAVVVRADGSPISPYDLKRLQAYASSLVDHHLIQDLVPPLARAYLAGRIPAPLSYTQAAILVCVGLQQHDIAKVEADLGLPASQVLALFAKAIRRLHGHLRAAKEAEVARVLPRAAPALAGGEALAPHEADMDQELDEAAKAIQDEMRAALLDATDLEQFALYCTVPHADRPCTDAVPQAIQDEMRAALLDATDLEQFAVRGSEADFDEAAGPGGAALRPGGMLSVKAAAGARPSQTFLEGSGELVVGGAGAQGAAGGGWPQQGGSCEQPNGASKGGGSSQKDGGGGSSKKKGRPGDSRGPGTGGKQQKKQKR